MGITDDIKDDIKDKVDELKETEIEPRAAKFAEFMAKYAKKLLIGVLIAIGVICLSYTITELWNLIP